MKQIIVDVSDLTIEEKQRVNEALAKITGATKLPVINPWAVWFFAPTPPSDSTMVTWGLGSLIKEPTHTPQQVLEMAGMAGMAEKRKVRADFDPKQPISVDVSGCTEEEKEEVQRAFFDVGIKWESGVARFRYPNAEFYTNSTEEGTCHGHLMYRTLPRKDSISRQQFLSMVYEAEQQGHVHAHLMALYAEDAKATDKPWELWQIKGSDGVWLDLLLNPAWVSDIEYRRKTKTHIVNGVEVPDLRFVPKENEEYYLPDPLVTQLYLSTYFSPQAHSHRKVSNLCYEPTEAGKQAAIAHAKAWLGIA